MWVRLFMVFPEQIFDRLHREFFAALKVCRNHPRRKAVHQLRTTARRLEALLHAAKRRQRGDGTFERKVDRALKALKPIRTAAGPVRDMDVQMQLLAEFVDRVGGSKLAGERDATDEEVSKLRTTLMKNRKDAAAELVYVIADATDKVLKDLNRLRTTLSDVKWQHLMKDAKGIQRKSAKDVAIEGPESLHRYRKRVKFARYLGEMEASAAAEHFVQRLKKVLDAIGVWHDWMLLAQLAREALGKSSTLTRLLKKERDRSLKQAIRSADSLRGRS